MALTRIFDTIRITAPNIKVCPPRAEVLFKDNKHTSFIKIVNSLLACEAHLAAVRQLNCEAHLARRIANLAELAQFSCGAMRRI